MDRLKNIDNLLASPAEYLPLSRKITAGEFSELKPIKLGMVSSFTAEFLRSYIVVETAPYGLAADLYIGEYNQVEQLCIDPASELYRHEPDVVVVALRLEDFLPSLYERIPQDGDLELYADRAIGRLKNIVDHIRSHTDASIFLWNFAQPRYLAAGLSDLIMKNSQAATVDRINGALPGLCAKFQNVYVFDLARLLVERGLANSLDQKMLYQARMPFNVETQRDIGRKIARYLHAVCCPLRKCLVLDLDGVMWGGVVGEDGIGNIDLGEDYPGNVYKEFQKYVLALRARGVLIAVASKNNPEDAELVFEKHPDCTLKLDDFACTRIGWEDKPDYLQSIADELNIGVNSLVFFDDSPIERELMRSQLPDVLVVDVPELPLDYIASLDKSGAFDYLVLSDEDRVRSELYRQEKVRSSLRHSSSSIDDFLKNLNMVVVCGAVDSITIQRVEQLIAKTNQFNLTTRRHSASDVERMIAKGAIAIWLRLSDRFGESGIVGVAIANPESGEKWLIDTLLLSCRVIGRKVEKILMFQLGAGVKCCGGRELIGEYIPTAKNRPFQDTYEKAGFTSIDEAGTRWRWDLTQGDMPTPDFISYTFEGGQID